jgi:hypothetical protein
VVCTLFIQVGYDPVTGTANENVTSAYEFPGMDLSAATAGTFSENDAGGLSDVSLGAAGHTTDATAEELAELEREAPRKPDAETEQEGRQMNG